MNHRERLLKEEKLERLLIWKYKTDPLYWLEHRLGEDRTSFEWSGFEEEYLTHSWDGDIDPLANAWRAVADVYREVHKGKDPQIRKIGVQAATGTSKTYWLARLAVWFLDVHEDSLVVTTAPKKQQLEIGLWAEISFLMNKVKKLRPKSHLYKLRLLMDNTGIDVLEGSKDFEETVKDAWQAVGFVAGVGSDEESAGRARGFHRKDMLIILEECPNIRLPVVTAFLNTVTGNHNIIVGVGNPDSEFDPLNQLCEKEDAVAFRVSAYDYPNVVLGREVFAGAVTNVSIRAREKDWGKESSMYKAMVRGICPTQSEDSLIKLEWLEQCIDLELDEEIHASYNAVGVDVSNSKAGDKASTVWGQGCYMLDLDEFYCHNATHLAYNLIMDDIELQEKGYTNYGIRTTKSLDIMGDCIGVDAAGLGVATVNALTDEGIQPQALQGGQWIEALPLHEDTGKPLYNFVSLRAQMWWKMREDLRLKRVSIKIKDKRKYEKLRRELCTPKFETKGGKIKVEEKAKIKARIGKSPNVGDAAVYWNWTRQGYRLNRYGFAAMFAGD